jgi:hypothetical protein
MYQIIGVQGNLKQRTVATSATAREALSDYRAHRKSFTRLIIHSPKGEAINGFELNRIANAEREADNVDRT